jgi:hypothetical protein
MFYTSIIIIIIIIVIIIILCYSDQERLKTLF